MPVEIPGLTFRERHRDDDPRILEIYLQYEEVFRFNLEAWRFHMDKRARGEGKAPVIDVAEADGRIVGDWYLEPHYSGAEGVYFAAVEVDQEYVGRGYGSALWADLERRLLALPVTKVYNNIPENLERSARFAQDRGFRKTGRADRISRLVLAEANLDGYATVEQSLAEKGITIVTVKDVPTDDETFMRKLYEAINSMVRDIPRSEENWEPDPFDIWRANFLQWPGSIPEAYFLALRDGEPVGMANLQKSGDGLLNGLTGVVPAERHQGIARALKLRTIQWAGENEFEYIDTANDSANAPMLSINIPLGYRALPAREEWLREYPLA